MNFIDEHCQVHGIEANCVVIPIVPSRYRRHAVSLRDAEKRFTHAKCDEPLTFATERVENAKLPVSGADRAWPQLGAQAKPARA